MADGPIPPPAVRDDLMRRVSLGILGRFMSVDWASRPVRAVDWFLALASLAVYAWTLEWPWLVGGILGCFLAWIQPLARLQGFVNHMMRRPGNSGRR